MLPFLMKNRSGTAYKPLDPPNPPILAGIEWEFLVSHSETRDHHPDDTRWYSRPDPSLETLLEGPGKTIRKSMSATHQSLAKVENTVRSSTGRVVFSRLETQDRNTGVYLLQNNGVKQIDHVNWLYQTYSTTADSSVHARDPDSKQWMDMRYDWLGAELRSGVFEEKELDETSTDSSSAAQTGVATAEITAICAALRESMRLQINHSCALQVTVSHQTTGGLTLLNLKRILTLVWILEPLIFGLCAPYRQTRRFCLPIRARSELSAIPLDKPPKATVNNNPELGSDNKQNNYTPYWEQEFNSHVGSALSALQVPTNSKTTNDDLALLRHHLLHLWHASNAPTLGCLIRSIHIPYDRLSVAIKFLGDGPMSTGIEFRMHEGTLDPILTKLWLNFCVALVKKATRLDKKGIGDLVARFVARAMDIKSDGVLHSRQQQNSTGDGVKSGDTAIGSMLRDLDIPEEEIRLWKKKQSWWEERPGVGLVLPLPRPWVMDGVISDTVNGKSKGDLAAGSNSNAKGRDLKGKGKNIHTSSEGSFLPRLVEDEHRLC